MAKGQPTRDRTIDRILEAALELFAARGYGATSIAELCSAAGVSRGSFYSNLKDKEEVFLLLFDRHATLQLARIRSCLQDNDSGAAASEIVAAALAPLAEERTWALLSAEFTVHAARDPQVAKRLIEHDRSIITAIGQILVRVRAVRTPDCASTCNQDTEARIVLALYEGVMAQYLVDPQLDPFLLLKAALHPILERL
ncbi:Putative TetR-family regulatory protein [Mycobacteroides abscessus subsp. massiliense]|uniref:TetR family transcriptional regulator n=1 Tax=Mycobacteroides abscessus subsp. bolletii 50594 TaxID=1303024 RepID=A0AB33ABT2_9MYCO|nr:TetR/AcrR family transcriptional regulator [Mycobacteroides abscessus]AGM29129.1 putative TetR family transcriptional regulator [Mycobacteroides abscessus subsp. bolletii 50594]MDO3297427.1 helix-turn-helix domain containing protein [Mycobacteroides abscessus subsp. massiliense]BBZ80846.1 TetR family transcriptional regulator [Mycobacteroides abscessus]SKU05621.1 Putative TetR-family regulatory protein [Mycobacteroides abscessus subsp. massiliense]